MSLRQLVDNGASDAAAATCDSATGLGFDGSTRRVNLLYSSASVLRHLLRSQFRFQIVQQAAGNFLPLLYRIDVQRFALVPRVVIAKLYKRSKDNPTTRVPA